MGLMGNTPAIAPAPKGILDPRTGKPIGSDDPVFVGINDELADKGFLVTATDELINWARTGSLDVDDLRPGLLRGGDDPCRHAALRPRAIRRRPARLAAPVGRASSSPAP